MCLSSILHFKEAPRRVNTQIRPYENMELTMANKHKSAFTLVEVLLSLAILGMLMAAVAVVLFLITLVFSLGYQRVVLRRDFTQQDMG